ncbi:MAG: alpha/beta fold hydrolase [Anaerolineae bacterium]|nr:alpha/beta fold hydrolase [Anaerolineae bacterium]
MQPWPELADHARQIHLPTSDLSLYLYDTGPSDVPLLVLIHGLGDEADTWRHLVQPLSDHYRVVALDLPGFGRSDQPRRAYTIPFFQTVLAELLDKLGRTQAILTGHSLGGAIAHAFTLAHPDRVNRLILIGGSLVARSQRLDLATLLFLVPGLGEWMYTRLRTDPEAAYQTLQPYYGDLDNLPEADRTFLFQRVNERVWSDGQRHAFFSTFRHLARTLPARQRNLAAELEKLATPTTAIWGERDRINPVENGRILLDLQPSVRLVIVPDAGHNVHQENPKAVLAAILETEAA